MPTAAQNFRCRKVTARGTEPVGATCHRTDRGFAEIRPWSTIAYALGCTTTVASPTVSFTPAWSSVQTSTMKRTPSACFSHSRTHPRILSGTPTSVVGVDLHLIVKVDAAPLDVACENPAGHDHLLADERRAAVTSVVFVMDAGIRTANAAQPGLGRAIHLQQTHLVGVDHERDPHL